VASHLSPGRAGSRLRSAGGHDGVRRCRLPLRPALRCGALQTAPRGPSQHRFTTVASDTRCWAPREPGGGAWGPADARARSLRCAIPSTSLHRRPQKRRRRASGALLAALVTSSIITADAAGPTALSARRCPWSRHPSTWVHFRLDCGPCGVLAAEGTQVRCPAAASMRRGSQRGGAVYEKERKAKQKNRNGRPASTAADQSTRRGGWRPVGCGAAHEQRSGRRSFRRGRRRSAPTWVVSDSGARRGPIGRRENAAWSGGTRRPFQCLAAGAFRIRFRNILRPSGPAALQQSSARPRCWELVPIHDVQA
jgi:hypothetical protein